MTSLTHRLPALHLSALHAGPRNRGRLLRLITRLYADRPVTALASPGYAGEPPAQRYAELRTLAVRRS